jgi:hypothetical protein
MPNLAPNRRNTKPPSPVSPETIELTCKLPGNPLLATTHCMCTGRAKGSTQQLLRARGLSSIHPFNAVSAPIPYLCVARLATEALWCRRTLALSASFSGSNPSSRTRLIRELVSSCHLVLASRRSKLSARISTSSDGPMTRYLIQKTEDSPHRTRSSIRCCTWSYIYDAGCSKRNNTRRGRLDIYADCGRHAFPDCRLLSTSTDGESLGKILRLWLSRWK